MNFNAILIEGWPKLSWVAEWSMGSASLFLRHGPMVEVSSDWAVEAVWDSDFKHGDFDQTENVFGTGVRIRDNKVMFVTSGHVFDRLIYLHDKEKLLVSNSLPGLLAVADLELRDDYPHYSKDAVSVIKGLTSRVATIPTTGPDLRSVYFNNLQFDFQTGELQEIEKTDTAPTFTSFEQYRDYLFSISRALGVNATDSSRSNPVKMLSGISSGYDSAVAAVVSKEAGCRDTVTIKKATSLWRGSDSGAPIASQLGMTCREYPRASREYSNEIALWAGEGRPGILNWIQFDYPDPLCLFFTGCHGEKVWDRVDKDHPDPFVRRGSSSHGLCEYRLWKGIFQCPVPFIGVRHSNEIKEITKQDEMRGFVIGKDYDKPIARRILEESGVSRKIFGRSNKNTSLESPFRWPYSMNAKLSFQNYLKTRGGGPPLNSIELLRKRIKLRHLFFQNFGGKIGWEHTNLLLDKIPGIYQVFAWANNSLKEIYLKSCSGIKCLK